MAAPAAQEVIEKLFRRHRIADVPMLCRALRTQSRMTVFRRLRGIGYRSSYSHAGAYYTLADIPEFDEHDLWYFQHVGFSRHGTLKATARQLVETADDGRTHTELEQRLRVRVHNALLGLVREGQIARAPWGPTYLYVSADAARAAAQFEHRRRLGEAATPAGQPPPAVVIEVLVEVIHEAQARAAPAVIAHRLRSRGVAVSVGQVAQILGAHGIEKKGARSRSRRSRR